MRRKIRIRRVDNYNCCCYLVCALALLHVASINNIINFDNIVPGRAIFVDGRTGGGGPQRQRQRQRQPHYYDDYVGDGSKDADNKDKILLNTAIIFAKEENFREENYNNNNNNNNDEETTSASSSYEKLLVKMTNENGVWRKQLQQNQVLTSHQQQQQQDQHRRMQDTFPEEVYDHDDDLYGNSSSITNGTTDREGEDEDETFTTSTTTSTTTTRTIPVLTRGIIAGLGISAYLVSIGSCIFVYVYRTHKSVAIGQPPFLYLICFGCILLSSQIYFYIITNSADHIIDDIVVVDDTNNSNTTTTTDNNTPTIVVSTTEDNNNNDTNQHPSYLDATCVGELWFDNVGIIFIYMSLFCKLWRAYKVTRFRRNVKILPKHVIYPFVVILTAVIVLTIAQTILDPPRWVLQEFIDLVPLSNGTGTGYSTTTTTFGACKTQYQIEDGIEFFFNNTEPTITTYDDSDSDSDSARYGWIPTSITWLQAISFLIVLGMAFIVRNIPEDISDSRNVCHALCANCCCAGSLITVWAIGYAIQNLTIMVSSRGLRKSFEVYALIGYLIFPKIYAVCYEKKYGHLPPPRQTRRQRCCCTRNRNTSTVVVGVRGQTHISGVTLPTAVPRPKNTKKRRTLATMIMSAFSSVNNDDADDDDDNKIVATEHLEREHKSSSSSILEEENNVSLSLSQSPSPLPSLKDSDAVAIIVSEDGIPLKMEDDDDNDNDNDEYDYNNKTDDDDEENWIFP
ncbi:hypothetical protein FRACYDRAFT_249033 [Fragilariopsis cylindrus CCMP1102]|uniref:G-protein coupled receptors family 3 profile domain-containing protein n=1 Tax=Fragilariopsis cylindrus CCMP1102 TaxID=635003 RepID=A0A1E7ESX8_9STRA|nr:hypothetical protein FRACYDRAFT_249033 [Fragilariopsis cylindrus CCMP1102]|eukprot:OEU09120.1 hypothetical protein FRACYDRAFT_249033 [Fragilariopsis cylindrus CCMP1102]